MSGDDVVAVLEFFANDAREPNDALLELMVQIGAQLGRVIERQRAEDRLRERAEELTRARDEAKAADVAKSAFLANMSHELRTPLNAILGFSEILKTELLGPLNNERYRSYAESIFASGSHLLGLINDVLDFAKLDAACLELNDEILDVQDIVVDCIRFMEPQASKAKVSLCENLLPSLPRVRADKRRLRQIFLNLLSNAVKFTREGGEVRVSAKSGVHGLDVLVSDTGIGMSPDQIPLALERFGQVDNKLARKYEGTGLGLPLTKQLLELHGGTLAIESALGRGTTVTVSFPPDRLVPLQQAA
jgi:signal transduction histidine kinase